MGSDVEYSLDALAEQLLAAHSANDAQRLVALYTNAADLREQAGDINAACFYLTHAFVFALEINAAERRDLQIRLWRHGREVKPEALE